MKNLKLLIADDHKMIRTAWGLLISQMDKVSIVGEASNGKEVLDALSKTPASIVLMDIDMPLTNGFETAKQIKEKHPWTKIIVLTMYNDASYVRKMLKIGVSGYLTKNSSNEELLNAIEIVGNGGKYICAEIQSLLLNKISSNESEKLTNREKEIVQLIMDGFSSKQISDKLFLSTKTVESHRGNIYRKLNVKNVAELINYASENFLV